MVVLSTDMCLGVQIYRRTSQCHLDPSFSIEHGIYNGIHFSCKLAHIIKNIYVVLFVLSVIAALLCSYDIFTYLDSVFFGR